MKDLKNILYIFICILGILLLLPDKDIDKIEIENEIKDSDLTNEFIISKTHNNIQITTIEDMLTSEEIKYHNTIEDELDALNLDMLNLDSKEDDLWKM